MREHFGPSWRRHYVQGTGFHCGAPALDDYLHITVSAAQVGVQQLSDVERKKLPRYPVPCFRMGRMARAIESREAGLGEVLIGCAVDRCLHARRLIGAYALLVNAKDEKAKSF